MCPLTTIPPFSIVIPAYDAAATIIAGLQALENQTVPRHQYEIIVVDDGSTDGTAELVQQFIQRQALATGGRQPLVSPDEQSAVSSRPSGLTKMIRQPHQGPSTARNAGAQAARGDLILFLDADCVPKRDWVERMTQVLQRDGIDGVGGMQRTRQRGLVPRFIQAEHDVRYERMAQQPCSDFIDTATAGYDRQAFTAVGGFATELPGAEDVELSFRLSETGYSLVFEPRAVVYHLHPESLVAYARRKYHYGYWRMMVYRRHPHKAVADSRTPQTQKVQIGLLSLLVAAALGAVFWREVMWLAGWLALLFLLVSIPFWWWALRRDLTVGLLVPLFLLVGTAAAGAGVIAGLVCQWVRRLTGD